MEQRRKILVADDDEAILEVIRILLEGEGYEVITVGTGDDAIRRMDPSVDLVILDVMMPGRSGIAACTEIRKNFRAPILFLTAKTTDADKVIGFSAGADDYLSKPFSYAELISRVKALIRRFRTYDEQGTPVSSEGTIRIRDLEVDTATNRVLLGGDEIALTDTEYQILLLLASNRKRIFSVPNIYESIWKEPYNASSANTVAVHVSNVRRKIEPDVDDPTYIKTVWGRGYRIE